VGWPTRDVVPNLAADEVHVWSIRLTASSHQIAGNTALLDATERNRADRFRFERHRSWFIVAHAQVRVILGSYLSVAPADLVFFLGSRGKPALVGHSTGRDVTFNLSHANDLALLAVSRGRELGIDVERIHSLDNMDQIVERYFCSTECQYIRTRPPHRRAALFFTYWTRKEALLKATGDGLWTPLNQVDVCDLGVVRVRDGSGATRTVTLIDLPPYPGHAASLAVEGPAWRLSGCWEWTIGDPESAVTGQGPEESD
jgi:4'-phosphopantetheinyl transferase